jgi:hypothetical protein
MIPWRTLQLLSTATGGLPGSQVKVNAPVVEKLKGEQELTPDERVRAHDAQGAPLAQRTASSCWGGRLRVGSGARVVSVSFRSAHHQREG